MHRSILYVLLLLPGLAPAQDLLEKAQSNLDQRKYDSAAYYVNLALQDDKSLKAIRLSADIAFYQNRLEDAVLSYRKVIAMAKEAEIPNTEQLAEAHSYLSECYGSMGEFHKAIDICRIALGYAENYQSPKTLADITFNLSTFFLRLGQFDSSLFYISKVYDMDVAAKDTSAIAYDYNTMGFLMGQKEEHEKAIEYYQLSIELLKPSQKPQLATRLSNVAMSQMHLKKFVESEQNFLRSISIFDSLKMHHKVIQHNVNLGVLYSKMSRVDKAEPRLKRALDYYQENKNHWAASRTGLQLAQMYYDQNFLVKARKVLKLSRSLAQENLLLQELVNAYELQTKIEDKAGNFANAYRSLRQLNALQDSLQKNLHLKRVSDLELRIVEQQKEAEIELLSIQNRLAQEEVARKKTEQMALIIVLGLMIVGAVVVFVLQKRKSKLAHELLSKEIDELRLQINAFINGKPDDFEVSMQQINEKLEQPLSEREFEVLQLALTEKNNREIAESVFVSVNTVKFHLKHIYEKLGVSSRKEALQFVIKS